LIGNSPLPKEERRLGRGAQADSHKGG